MFMAPIIAAAMLTVPVEVISYFLGHISSNIYWIVTRLLLDFFCLTDIFVQAFTGCYDSENRVVILNPRQYFWYTHT